MSLEPLRKKIDSFDSKIVYMLNERAKLSKQIGEAKLKDQISIYSPAREKKVLNHLRTLNKGPISKEALEAIYREIMSSSLSLEKPLRIASLGTQGSFTYIAARKKFGSQVEYVSCRNIPEVFQRVEQGDCDYGVAPVENSVEGAVTDTFDLLVDSELKICSQVLQKISHYLLSKERSLKNIRKIHSNPQVFGQCRSWLSQNLPKADLIMEASTTQAAEIATKQKYSAAIASREAGEIYNLNILEDNLQDIAHNTTRFLIIAKGDAPATGKDRTTILFSIKDKMGALHAMLSPFLQYKINLTKIESRPSKKKAWDYYFFVDFEGHRLDKNVMKALAKLEVMCKYLKVVGSYPVLE